jgi:hypothetical protein
MTNICGRISFKNEIKKQREVKTYYNKKIKMKVIENKRVSFNIVCIIFFRI